MSNIQLSSRTDQWATPKDIIDRVYCTFGSSIDLDPASSELANAIVGAGRFITEEEDGLESDWIEDEEDKISVFINPPSGKVNGEGKTKLFWKKLIEHYESGFLEQAIFLGFSVEQLAILQDCSYDPLDFSICIPRKRIKFVNLVSPEHKDRPTHSNFICYIDGTVDNRQKFKDCFSDLGKVVLKTK
jgi:hypothetical protein